MTVTDFANELIAELCAKEPRAAKLCIDARAKTIAVGVRLERGFLPLIGLANPSAKTNVMNLWLWGDGDWIFTPWRGTPSKLAAVLLSDLHDEWAPYVPVAPK